MNDLGLYGLYERYDMGEAIVRERKEKPFQIFYLDGLINISYNQANIY